MLKVLNNTDSTLFINFIDTFDSINRLILSENNQYLPTDLASCIMRLEKDRNYDSREIENMTVLIQYYYNSSDDVII